MHSTDPPLGTRTPSSRAGKTRVLFATSTSPSRRYCRRSPMTPCSIAPVARSRASRRDSPRGTGRCAISSSGRSKSKSDTRIQGPFHANGRVWPNRCIRISRSEPMQEDADKTVMPADEADDAIVVHQPSDAASGGPEPLVIRMPVDIRNVALSVIAVILSVLFLQYAQAVLIPVVIGMLTFYALDPIVDRIQKAGVPRVLGAALVLAALLGATGYGVWTLR